MTRRKRHPITLGAADKYQKHAKIEKFEAANIRLP
jgi:hypothetical protein